MRIDLSKIDQEQFFITEGIIAGEKCFLVQPKHIAVKWTQENKIFRSSIWNSEGELVSASFPKFCNWGENLEHFPVPETLEGCTIAPKIDGSTVIVSKYKGQWIFRTRGTFDARVHSNGHEIDLLVRDLNYLDVGDTWNKSLLFEWYSPNNRIILNYGDKPLFWLIGGVEHDTYRLFEQTHLTADYWAMMFNYILPKTYQFDSIEQLIGNVEHWRGLEGVCLYSNNDQVIHKLKANWYLNLHRLKSEISSTEKLLDVWFMWGKLDYQAFLKKIEETFDYELLQQVQPNIDQLYKAIEKAANTLMGLRIHIPAWSIMSKKEAALEIIRLYEDRIEKGIAFQLLKGNEINDQFLKKLVMQCLILG